MWLGRDESKALEKEMIVQFQHSDSDAVVGGLARLRVYSDRLVLETFSRQKYDFARGLLDQWFGTKLSFYAKSIEDVDKMAPRRVVLMQEALYSWLASYRNHGGPVCNGTYVDFYQNSEVARWFPADRTPDFRSSRGRSAAQ